MGAVQSKTAPVPAPVVPQQALKEVPTKTTDESQEPASSGGGGGGCPMKNVDGSYRYDWKALFRRNPHGPHGETPLTKDDLTQNANGSLQQANADAGGSGGCPVKHAPQAGSAGGCPVKEYNVYSQPIDKNNQMPSNPNQLPAPGQQGNISTNRVSSSISKGGTTEGTTWTYPSPQMFYNALSRKGKLGDTKEEDMESVVAVHNNMNEKTWNRVVEWEKVLDPDSTPKLLKFMGRPTDLSPKAYLKHYLLGHPLPYDRHDWTILRTDGSTVRYVIDYYHDETRAQETPESALPNPKDHAATPSLLVDVRPAVDTPTLVWNRAVTMPYAQQIDKSTDYEFLPMAPTTDLKSQVQESLEVWSKIQASALEKQQRQDMANSITEDDAKALAKSFSQILKDCQAATQKMERCKTDEEQQQASLDLTICMSKLVCPDQHKALITAVNSDNEDMVEAALDNVSSCVITNTSRRSVAKQKFPTLFE